MNELTCYRCNAPLSDEEVQRWQPFGQCDACEASRTLMRQIAHGNQAYWSQPSDEQHRLRLLFGETR
jgi:hypothetical protein